MSSKTIILISALLSLLSLCMAYPNGAPEVACESLTPGHQPGPSQEPNPYTLDVSLNLISGVPLYSVRLAATGTPFRGFILQAKSSAGEALGTLLPDGRGMSQELNCSWPILNTLTHTSREQKSELIVNWSPPADWNYETEKVTFKASVVQQTNTFWTGMEVVGSRDNLVGAGTNVKVSYLVLIFALFYATITF